MPSKHPSKSSPGIRTEHGIRSSENGIRNPGTRNTKPAWSLQRSMPSKHPSKSSPGIRTEHGIRSSEKASRQALGRVAPSPSSPVRGASRQNATGLVKRRDLYEETPLRARFEFHHSRPSPPVLSDALKAWIAEATMPDALKAWIAEATMPVPSSGVRGPSSTGDDSEGRFEGMDR